MFLFMLVNMRVDVDVCVSDSWCSWSSAALSSIVSALGWLAWLPPLTQWEGEFSRAIGTIDESYVYISPSENCSLFTTATPLPSFLHPLIKSMHVWSWDREHLCVPCQHMTHKDKIMENITSEKTIIGRSISLDIRHVWLCMRQIRIYFNLG